MNPIVKNKNKKEIYEIIRFKLSSFDVKSLDETTKSLFLLLEKNNFEVKGPVFLPNKRFTIVLFKPIFVHKKNSKEEFEQIIHNRIMDVKFFVEASQISLATIFQYYSIRPEIEITISRLADLLIKKQNHESKI